MTAIRVLVCFIALVLAMPAVGAAPPGTLMRCDTPEGMARDLRVRFGEVPIATAVDQTGFLMQIFVSSETGSWTAVRTSPEGRSCIAASGNGWQELTPQPVGEDT